MMDVATARNGTVGGLPNISVFSMELAALATPNSITVGGISVFVAHPSFLKVEGAGAGLPGEPAMPG